MHLTQSFFYQRNFYKLVTKRMMTRQFYQRKQLSERCDGYHSHGLLTMRYISSLFYDHA